MISAVLLAAGKSTRMRSKIPKGLHPLCGKPVLGHIIDACRDAGIEDIVVVVGYQGDRVREALGDGVRYVEQTEQKGTGHAVTCARGALPDDCRCLLVLAGDVPLVTGADLRPLLDEHVAGDRAATVVTAVLPDAREYGRIVRGGDGHLRIVETKGGKAPPEVLAIGEFNTAVYCFDPRLVFDALDRIGCDNEQGEYFLTDVIELLSRETGRVSAYRHPDAAIWLGLNNRVELAEARRVLQRRILEAHMLAGVTIIDPDGTFIDASVRIGPDTTILPGTILRGDTVVGEDCEIGPYAVLTDARVGDGVTIAASMIADSEIGGGSRCGPWSHLRPGNRVGRGVKLGNFVELKGSTVEDGVSIGHVGYIGDTDVGEGTNIGAGTIVCNYDGRAKHRTAIGRRAFIGSQNTLVAPVRVGEGAYTAAGSVITHEVPADGLALGRSRQVNKPGWAARRRNERKGEER